MGGGTSFHRRTGLGGGMPLPKKKRNEFSLEVACFNAFSAVRFVRILARKTFNLPPEVVIWWRLKMYFREIVNTLSE